MKFPGTAFSGFVIHAPRARVPHDAGFPERRRISAKGLEGARLAAQHARQARAGHVAARLEGMARGARLECSRAARHIARVLRSRRRGKRQGEGCRCVADGHFGLPLARDAHSPMAHMTRQGAREMSTPAMPAAVSHPQPAYSASDAARSAPPMSQALCFTTLACIMVLRSGWF